jgi:O-antigen/teichoic acid export membrane protein
MKNQRKIGAILSYLNSFLNILVGIIYVPILLKFMGKDEYGLYQLLGSVISYFSMMDFGISTAITRYYTKFNSKNEKIKKENLLSMGFGVYGIITVLIVVIGIFFYFSFENIFMASLTSIQLKNAKIIYLILLANILVTIPTNVFTSVITAHERFIFLRLLSIIQIFFQPFVVIAVMTVSPTAVAMVVIQTLFNFLSIFLKIYYSFKKLKLKIKFNYFDKELFLKIIKFSFFIFLTFLMDQIFLRSNQVILGIMANTAVVAIYSAAAQIHNGYMSISTAINGIFLPKITKMITNKCKIEELSKIFIKIGRIQFLLLSCVLTGFINFGQQFIAIWVGSGFEETYTITLCLIIPFTIDLIQNIGLIILQAQNKYAFRAIAFLGMAIINITTASYFAKKFGGVGCGIITGISFLIENLVFMNIYYAKFIKLDIKLFWKEIIKILIPSVFCCTFGYLLNYFSFFSQIFNFTIKIAFYSLIYTVVMWIFALNLYEKNLIKQICNFARNILKGEFQAIFVKKR